MAPQTLDTLLADSKATDAFKQAVRDVEQQQRTPLIDYASGNPATKVLRFLSQLLESMPKLEIERVKINAHSSCSGYRGEAQVWPGPLTIAFDWDCKWRAEQEGWSAFFGYPDQSRAAREFGYRCFRQFEVTSPQPVDESE